MSIRKLMIQGDDSKKNISRTFRLRPTTLTALEKLSEKNNISQNEVINIILNESYEDFLKLERAEKVLSNPDTENIILDRKYNGDIDIQFKVTPDYECTMSIGKFDKKQNEWVFLDCTKFKIQNIYELLDYGINSTFSGIPKVKDK